VRISLAVCRDIPFEDRMLLFSRPSSTRQAEGGLAPRVPTTAARHLKPGQANGLEPYAALGNRVLHVSTRGLESARAKGFRDLIPYTPDLVRPIR